MTTIAMIVFAIEVSTVVAGQVLLKHAMESANTAGFRNRRVLALFLSGIAAMTISFFLTLALLQHFDLSFFVPVQASSTILVVAAAAIFLRERLSFQLLVGTLLIAGGIALVSTS